MPDEMAEAANRDYRRKNRYAAADRALTEIIDAEGTPGGSLIVIEETRNLCREEAARLVRAWD